MCFTFTFVQRCRNIHVHIHIHMLVHVENFFKSSMATNQMKTKQSRLSFSQSKHFIALYSVTVSRYQALIKVSFILFIMCTKQVSHTHTWTIQNQHYLHTTHTQQAASLPFSPNTQASPPGFTVRAWNMKLLPTNQILTCIKILLSLSGCEPWHRHTNNSFPSGDVSLNISAATLAASAGFRLPTTPRTDMSLNCCQLNARRRKCQSLCTAVLLKSRTFFTGDVNQFKQFSYFQLVRFVAVMMRWI